MKVFAKCAGIGTSTEKQATYNKQMKNAHCDLLNNVQQWKEGTAI